MANRRVETGRCNIVPREASGAAENFGGRSQSAPGDFCREVVIVRARFAFALVAQLDRASDFESEGREFESLRARQKNQ
jgi:hypothetical protein